jgi:adiponectin receptor
VNIHTHLIPFLTWASRLLPSFSTGVSTYDVPERLFLVFACVCLFASTVWHTMSGCAHEQGMELSARVDYVGIGWLISASVGTVVYYGFQAPGHEWAQGVYLSMCLMMGLTGSVFPFMSWFNMREYKVGSDAFVCRGLILM